MDYASIATRHSLLTRLKDWDDQEGWKRFFETYWRLIYGMAIKSGLSETEAQEVVQETVVAVANKMRQLRYDPARGSFKAWLFQLTRWRIGDQFRKRRPNHVSLDVVAAPDAASTEIAPDALKLEWEQRWKENLVDAAMEQVKRRVSARQFQIFDLHVSRQWPVREVARALGITTPQVYLAKCRVLALLKKEVRRLEAEMI